MPALRALAFALLTAALPFSLAGAAQVHKCTINGSVTYQADPCPSGQVRRTPTVEQLNAERQKKSRPATATATADRGASASSPSAQSSTTTRCDGRTQCSQMTSCTEAKYFLAHCPGVKMDGDGDGTPCELQWCNK